jgi:hypothetical protein
VRHEDWQAHARQEVISNAAQQFFPKPWMAEGARDDQIGAERARFGLQPVGNRVWRNIIDLDTSAEAPCRLRCSTMCSPGRPPCARRRSDELIMRTVVRSARSISGTASLTDRAAGRLEFQATALKQKLGRCGGR